MRPSAGDNIPREHRVKFEADAYAGGGLNPTEKDALARSSPPGIEEAMEQCFAHSRLPRLKPMAIERLLLADWPLSTQERARVLYHQLGDADAVADRLQQPRSQVRQWLADDVAQRKQNRAG